MSEPETAEPLYAVLTWDGDRQEYTPQPGVDCGPHTLFGLRRALRELRLYGYPARRPDPAVLVYRLELRPSEVGGVL